MPPVANHNSKGSELAVDSATGLAVRPYRSSASSLMFPMPKRCRRCDSRRPATLRPKESHESAP